MNRYYIVIGKAGFVLYQLVQASSHFFYPLIVLPGIDIQLPPIMPNLSEEQVTIQSLHPPTALLSPPAKVYGRVGALGRMRTLSGLGSNPNCFNQVAMPKPESPEPWRKTIALFTLSPMPPRTITGEPHSCNPLNTLFIIISGRSIIFVC